jgi:hypothetical protein
MTSIAISSAISHVTPRIRDINIRNLCVCLYPHVTDKECVRDNFVAFNDDVNLKVALFFRLLINFDTEHRIHNHTLKKFFICNNTEMTIDGMHITPTHHNYIYCNFNDILRNTMININTRIFFSVTDNRYDSYREDIQHQVQLRNVANFILRVSQNFIIYYLNNHVLPGLTNPEDIVKVKLEALSAYTYQINHILCYIDRINGGTAFRKMSYEILMDERYNRFNRITPRHGQNRRDIEYIKFENTIFATHPLFTDLVSQELYEDIYNDDMDVGNRQRGERCLGEEEDEETSSDEDEEEDEEEEEDDE